MGVDKGGGRTISLLHVDPYRSLIYLVYTPELPPRPSVDSELFAVLAPPGSPWTRFPWQLGPRGVGG